MMIHYDAVTQRPSDNGLRQWFVLYCSQCRTAVEAAMDDARLMWEALPAGHAGARLIQGDLVRDGELYSCPPCRGVEMPALTARAWPPQMDPNDPTTLRGFMPSVEPGRFTKDCQAPLCSKRFEAKHADARFCSRSCTRKAARRRRSRASNG